MSKYLQQLAMRRKGGLTRDQYVAAVHISETYYRCGYEGQAIDYSKVRVDMSMDKRKVDDSIVSRMHALKLIVRMKEYIGPISWSVLEAVCIREQSITGRFENELLRRSLDEIYKEFVN